jgi:hypothetical protein
MIARTVHVGIAMVLLIAASGCGGSDTAGQPAQKTSPVDSTHGVPFNLYTHCGIEWARIRGTFWRAEHELNDGSGNPPEGWGNPSQAGRLSFQSRRTATFSSTAGLVIFHRTSRSKPPFICS